METGEHFRDLELQNLLSDERSRCKQYRQIYQTLKEEHTKLKEELEIIHQQLKESVERNTFAKASNESFIRKLEDAIKEKQEEIIKLKKLANEQNPENVRKKVQEEERSLYEQQIQEVEAHADSLQDKYNGIMYDNSVLTTQLDFLQKENERAMELLKSEHTLQITDLKLKIDDLESQISSGAVKDCSIELRQAEGEILRLNTKLKTARVEYEEARLNKEDLASQMQSESLNHLQQINDHVTKIKMLEAGKEASDMQKEVLQNENVKLRCEKEALEENLQKNRQEFFLLKSQLSESLRKYEIETANLNITIKSQKNNNEELKEKYARDMDHLKAQYLQLQAEYNSNHKNFVEKESSFHSQLLLSKQQAVKRCNDAEDAKERLEMELKLMETKKNDEIVVLREKMDSFSARWQLLAQERLELEKNNLILKTKLDNHSKGDQGNYDTLMRQNAQLHQDIEVLKESMSKIFPLDGCMRSASSVEHAKGVMDDLALPNRSDSNLGGFREMADLKLSMEQQKYQSQLRIENLQNQIKSQQECWNGEKRELQSKTKRYSKLITKLRDRLSVHEAQIEDLEIQNDSLKQNVPVDDHFVLRSKLSDLQKRQAEFREIMFAGLPFLGDIQNQFQSSDSPSPKKKQPPQLVKFPQELDRRKHLELPAPTKSGLRKSKKTAKRTTRKVPDYSSTSDVEI